MGEGRRRANAAQATSTTMAEHANRALEAISPPLAAPEGRSTGYSAAAAATAANPASAITSRRSGDSKCIFSSDHTSPRNSSATALTATAGPTVPPVGPEDPLRMSRPMTVPSNAPIRARAAPQITPVRQPPGRRAVRMTITPDSRAAAPTAPCDTTAHGWAARGTRAYARTNATAQPPRTASVKRLRRGGSARSIGRSEYRRPRRSLHPSVGAQGGGYSAGRNGSAVRPPWGLQRGRGTKRGPSSTLARGAGFRARGRASLDEAAAERLGHGRRAVR